MTGRVLSPARVLVAVLVGAAAWTVVAVAVAPGLGPLAGWCAAGLVSLVWAWRICWRQDPAGTERLAREEAESRVTDEAILVACIASIAATIVGLMSSNTGSGPISVASVILSVLGTMIAWTLVNTVYALKYARMYFLDHRGSGFDVKQDEAPSYSDFAALAFTIGMSYAVSDIEPTSSAVRRKALPHALLSYFFGTVLIAVAINLETNLGQN